MTALAAALSAGCASTRDKKEEAKQQNAGAPPPKKAAERIEDTKKGVADAAMIPLRDVGLLKPNVPDMLQRLANPYEVAGLQQDCSAIAYEIGALDAMLGLETYTPGRKKELSERGIDAAQDAFVGAAESAANVIPFRGVVRKASGAEKAQRDYIRAIELGRLRRAFLRGAGAVQNCQNVLPKLAAPAQAAPPPAPAPAAQPVVVTPQPAPQPVPNEPQKPPQ